MTNIKCPITQLTYPVRRFHEKGQEYDIDIYVGSHYRGYIEHLG